MMNLALMLLSMSTAHARDVKHYLAACKDGSVIYVGHSSHIDDENALDKGLEICHDGHGGVRDMVEVMAPKGDQDQILIRAQSNYDKLLQSEREAQANRGRAKKEAQEEARKAEELLLQEEARKAEEARKVAAAREAEVRECEAKMTYIPPAWACPFGDYVADPNECSQLEGRTRSGDHAVQVDLGYRILPPGVSCPLRADKADVSHERLYGAVLSLANFSYNGEERPEGFDFDVAAPVKQALANWQKAEDRRLAAIPYDCLAGVCLNAPETRIADKLVTVSEVVMHRTVEVCSGRVVEISVWAGWVLPEYGGFVDILSGAQHATYSDGTPAVEHVWQIHSEMETMGWEVLSADGFFASFEAATKKGTRRTGWGRSENGSSWPMYLKSTHPDKDALCAPERQQGL